MSSLVRTSEVEKQVAKLRAGKAVKPSELADMLENLLTEREKLVALDKEAAAFVETVICLRTDFTGEAPYTGWKGLGMALTEALDERDELRDFRKKAIKLSKKILKAVKENEAHGEASHSWPCDDNHQRVEAFAVTIKTDIGTALPTTKGRFSQFARDTVAVIDESAPNDLGLFSTLELMSDQNQ